MGTMSAKELIGLSEAEAENHIKDGSVYYDNNGERHYIKTLRICRGIGTCDYKTDRLNCTIKDGLVSEVHVG